MILVKIGTDTWIDLEKVVAIVEPRATEARFTVLLASMREVIWLSQDLTQQLIDKLQKYGMLGD